MARVKSKLIFCLLTGLGLSLVIQVGLGQEERIDLTGQVTNSKGEPIKFAKVILLFKTWNGGYRQRVLTSKTDMSGSFSLPRKYARGERNSFLLTVFANGQAFDSRYIRNFTGEPLDPIKVTLQPAVPKVFKVQINGQPAANARIVPLSRINKSGERHYIYHQAANKVVEQCDAKGHLQLPYFQVGDTAEFKLTHPEIAKSLKIRIDDSATQIVNFTIADDARAVVKNRWTPDPVKIDAKLIDWIQHHAVKFRTVDPQDEKFEDLQPLKTADRRRQDCPTW